MTTALLRIRAHYRAIGSSSRELSAIAVMPGPTRLTLCRTDTMRSFGLGVCVWISWLFIVFTVADPKGEAAIAAIIFIVAATILTVYVFHRLAPKKRG